MDNPPVLDIRTLTHRYGENLAVDDVSLAVPAGQICAVLGHNGAGKTTLIRCALGLLRPSAGQVSVLGARAGTTEARLGTGVMLQDTDLSDLLTGREQLNLFATYFHTPSPVDALIDETGIRAFVDTRYKRLSGGQKRRIQFALALIGQPRLLFLDEPTTGLDADARRAVWENVRQLADRGVSVVLTTHYLEEADALSDRIVVLSNGRVLADDSADAIRMQTGGALIRCATSLTVSDLQALPGVRSANLVGRRVELLCDDAPETLRTLLGIDAGLRDLEVSSPSLEQAFTALSKPSPGCAA